MSSESEDEFQSADEGSDFEDSYPLDSQDTAPTKSVPLPTPSYLAATKEVKENVHLPEPIKDSKVESSEPVEEFDADDETEEEIQEKPQTKSFDDKVTNLMSALDQLSVRVSKQLTKSTSKAEPADEEDTDEEDTDEEDIHKCSMEKDQEKGRQIKEEQELKMEEERKRELETEAERKRLVEREEERKREIEREEEKKNQIEKEEERKRQEEQEEERKRELEREKKRKEELEREEERKRELEREEERKKELEREEKRKKELEREEERKKELEREELRKKEIAKEEEKKREIEEEKKRKMEEEEEMRKEKEKEEERKRELEKEEEMKRESPSEQENRGGQEKNAGNTQDHPAAESQKAKPIRESKIGMKKPREKLGERMGARRLGAKIEKKPLESISSDSCVKPQDTTWSKEESQTDSVEAQQREVERKKEEKWRKQQQWEEQQKRWQQINKSEDTKEQEEDTSWGGGWGGWGTSLLTAASTFTREVGRGVGTVMETVEGTLGVPDPETLAREVAERDRELKEKLAKSEESISREKTPDGKAEDEPESEKTGDNPSNQSEDTAGHVPSYGLGGLSSLGSLVSGVSGALETASSKVLLGGLDTLEVIGRKAMTVIQEGDPGLRKKRAFLTNNKPNLSMMLQEARQRAAQEESDQRDGIQNKESGLFHRPNFDQAWENTEGPVHVEALSLVAKQCEMKMSSLLQSMPPYLVDRIQKSNLIIKKTCEMDEESQLEGDFATQVTKIISQIRLPLHSQKIREAWGAIEETASLIEEKKKLDWTAVEKEVYLGLAFLISQLAALTHKGSELALITPGSDPQAIANSFRELSSLVCAAMENTVDNICGTITAKASAADPDVNNTITNMYLQGASGNSCVQEGMMFLSSVLQYANTKLLAADL